MVQWEYASEERLAARNAAYNQLVRGTRADDLTMDLARRFEPRRVLDVGCGMGELAERVQSELDVSLVAVDLSPRMVELARQRGLETHLADVQSLPFGDASFDLVIANWVLYHVPDLQQGLREIVRVLEPGGHLIAATVGEGNMRELWALVCDSSTRDLSFGPENGEEILRQQFADVERHDAIGTAVFPDTASIRHFVSMTITRAHLADRVPEVEGPFETRSAHTVFVAAKP